MVDDPNPHGNKPPATPPLPSPFRECLKQAFRVPDEGSKWFSYYPLGLYALYILTLLILPLFVAKHLTEFWDWINTVSAAGTVIFGILLAGVEWIVGAQKAGRPSVGPFINIVAYVSAIAFLIALMKTEDVHTHLVMLFMFSTLLVMIDLAVYCRFLNQQATDTQLLKRRLILFGVDLPLATGLLMLIVGMHELSYVYSGEAAVIDAFVTGALALELSLTNAAVTYLIVFTKD